MDNVLRLPLMKLDSSTLGLPEAEMWIVADDGFPLAATRFRAQRERVGVALVAPGCGLSRRFYRPLARALAKNGWDVLTWDFRGVADSRLGVSYRDRRLSLHAWGALDLAAVIDRASKRAVNSPVVMVGHSISGPLLGHAPNAGRIDALALVASPHPWLGHWPLGRRLALAGFWSVVAPVMALATGRLSMSAVSGAGDVPARVAREWASWSKSRDGMAGGCGFDLVTAPIRSYTFSDDHLAPKRAADALLSLYSKAGVVEHHHIEPAELGATRIGHLGYFGELDRGTHWQELMEFLAGS